MIVAWMLLVSLSILDLVFLLLMRWRCKDTTIKQAVDQKSFVISDKALSFPAKPCHFQQTFVVS
jgi:hypothetical protein